MYLLLLFLFAGLIYVSTDGVKCLVAQIVLYLAGIIFGNGGINPEGNEEIRKFLMSGVYLIGDIHTLLGNRDETGFVHLDVAFLAQTLHGIADAGLCNTQETGNIDRTYISVLFLKDDHRLEIIFSGFSDGVAVVFHILHPVNEYSSQINIKLSLYYKQY